MILQGFHAATACSQHQQDHSRDAAEGLKIPTMEELRAEWIRRGLRARDFDKMKTVTGIEAKQRVKLIEHDHDERRHGSAKQSGEVTSTTDPESEQWWTDEEDNPADADEA